jgi:fatty-acyl-CoA synthase
MGLWDALFAERALGARDHWLAGGELRSSKRKHLVSDARRVAGALVARIDDGEVVGCLLTNSPAATAGAFGVWCAGHPIASLPVISRGMSMRAYIEQLTALCRAASITTLLVEEQLLRGLAGADLKGTDILSFESLIGSQALADPRPLDEHSTAFVQFSSGTTSRPRGVALTPRAIAAQLERLAERLELEPDRDAAAIWLPLSHDMGFFGWLLSWYGGFPCHLSTPARFLSSPWTWLDDCADAGATITPVPPYALAVAARAMRASRSSGTLREMRRLILGGDRIDIDEVRAAASVLERRGLCESAIAPAYGLAEATLAVTLSPVGEGLAVGKDPCRDEQPLAACGPPLRDFEVRIDAAAGGTGEICVKAPSLFKGYLGETAVGPSVPDELRTGDLGFLRGGRLHVAGRLDDMLKLHGRNIFARDIEDAFRRDRRVRAGACAVVDLDVEGGRPRFVAVAETEVTGGEAKSLARALARIAVEHAGLPLDECVFLRRGAFPKTPSGKVQRFRCRELAREASGEAHRVELRGRPVTIA